MINNPNDLLNPVLKIGENKILNEFKAFIMRGNVLDMAIGVIIGGAFGKIVSSLVSDVLMPPIGRLMGGVDFSNLFINLGKTSYATLKDAQTAGAPTLNYGLFLNAILNFMIVAATIFILVRQVSKLYPKPAEAPAVPTTKECRYCLSAVPIKATRCAHCTSENI